MNFKHNVRCLLEFNFEMPHKSAFIYAVEGD